MRKIGFVIIIIIAMYFASCTSSSKDVPKDAANKDSVISSTEYDRTNIYNGKRYDVNLYLYASGILKAEISDAGGTQIYSHQYQLPSIKIPPASTTTSGNPPLSGWLDSDNLLICFLPNTKVNNKLIYPKYDFMSIINIKNNTNYDKLFVANNPNDSDVLYPPVPWYNKSILAPVNVNGNIYALTAYDYSFNISYTENTNNIDNYNNTIEGFIPLSYSTYITYRDFPTNISKLHLNGQKDWTSFIPINEIPINIQSLDSLTSQIDKNTVVFKTKYILSSGKDTSINFVIDTSTGKEIKRF